MNLQRLIFGMMYRIGFTPWEGHALPKLLQEQAESLPKGKALDIGCGTGDTSIYLAKHGWEVTAVDFVEKALDRARARAAIAGTKVRFQRADITRASEAGIGSGFGLLVDNGCLHGLSDPQRDAYTRELNSLAAPGATLVLTAFEPGGKRPPRGMTQEEVRTRFGRDWDVISHNENAESSGQEGRALHTYVLRLRKS